MSWPVTLAERPELMQKLAVHPKHIDVTRSTSMIYAPCCGRRTAADTVVSLHGLKTEISAGNHQPKKDHDWACDGCLHLLILDKSNAWTRSKLFRALGAPASVIRHERARELQLDAERAAHARGEGVDPKQVYEKAHASLPANVRELPGTEPPSGI